MRWLLAVLALLAASPAMADELRPVSIQFEQVDDTLWSLNWKQPVVGPADNRLIVPTLPAPCRLASEPRREIARSTALPSRSASTGFRT